MPPSRRFAPLSLARTAVAVALIGAALAVVLSARGPVGGSTVTGTGDAKLSDVPAAPARLWGVTMPGVPDDLSPVQALAHSVGQSPGIVMWYVAWSLNSPFPAADADGVRATGALPEITWEPWDPAAGVDQPAYALARIADGAFDDYLQSWADAAAAWGHPVRLRFAHEMNGSWYPWAAGVNGNTADSYLAAWRHVRAVFAGAGASNVSWVWSPNVPFQGSTALAAVFPGDDAVDEVALDGYNWAGSQPDTTWTSFADTFGSGVRQLQRLSTRPIGIGEVGCPEVGGSKAAWLTDMWQTLRHWTQVRTLTWFDYDKEADWRIDSSPAAVTAFAAGLGRFVRH